MTSFCRVCGKAGYERHHIIFRSHGGPDEDWNLVRLCRGCHRRAHGVGMMPPLTAWRLHLVAMTGRSYDQVDFGLWSGQQWVKLCVSCKYRRGDSTCEIWDEQISFDYSCGAWQKRSSEQ